MLTRWRMDCWEGDGIDVDEVWDGDEAHSVDDDMDEDEAFNNALRTSVNPTDNYLAQKFIDLTRQAQLEENRRLRKDLAQMETYVTAAATRLKCVAQQIGNLIIKSTAKS